MGIEAMEGEVECSRRKKGRYRELNESVRPQLRQKQSRSVQGVQSRLSG